MSVKRSQHQDNQSITNIGDIWNTSSISFSLPPRSISDRLFLQLQKSKLAIFFRRFLKSYNIGMKLNRSASEGTFGALVDWMTTDWLVLSFHTSSHQSGCVSRRTQFPFDEWYVFKAVHSFYPRLSQQGTFTKLHLNLFGSAKNITIIIAGTDNLGIVFRSLPPAPAPVRVCTPELQIHAYSWH